MAGIFISYRREDSAGYAGRLFDWLSAHVRGDSVFMDLAEIDPGLDFVAAIDSAIGKCDVMLAVIASG
jgi:TIR domain